MKKLILTTLLVFGFLATGAGQKKIVRLPDLPGYVTLKCDLHIHTVFSDGDVWPDVRVDEAIRDGLDAIAITDHIEYTPKKDYIKTDYNAAYNICRDYAAEKNLILIHGAEITRDMPPGHFNALFIEDASPLVRDSAYDAIAEAVKQGAFIQWNHPGWKAQEPDGIPKLYNIHLRLLNNGWINGIEFFNESEYYPLVLTFCQKYNLAVTGNSDIHGLISEFYTAPAYSNRPMTLVFAKERTLQALKEALFAGRTLVYFRDIIAGREDLALPFFQGCIRVSKPYMVTDKSIFFEITNNSDIPFQLVNGPVNAPPEIHLAPNSVTRVVVDRKFSGALLYDVKNIITGENKVLKAELRF
jgi:3',5'-nucleoside bisphosphate phosphatase